MDLSQIRVLVADDEPKLRALVANALRTLGCNVTEAQDGDEAWRVAQQSRVDVVVLDVMMPGMSGWDVCRRIKTDRALRDSRRGPPKVLMLTGIGEAVNEMTSPLFSADAWLDKPFSMREMTAKVLELAAARDLPPPSRPPDVLSEGSDGRPPQVPARPNRSRSVGPSLKKVVRDVPAMTKTAPTARSVAADPESPAPKRAARPAAKKVAKKAARPAAKKVAKKAARPASKKVAKKAARPVAKKVAKKARGMRRGRP